MDNLVFLQNSKQHGISGFRAFYVGSGAKIVDLRDFFENTRYCGKCCTKIAYMVKFGRELGMLRPFFSCTGLFERGRGLKDAESVIMFFASDHSGI